MRRRRRRIELAGQLIAGVISGIVSGLLALVVAFMFFGARPGRVNVAVITPTPFGEVTPRGPLNGSALVSIADGRFLVVDDLTDDAFYELHLAPDGTQAGPLERRPIVGLEAKHVEDFEGATLVETNGERIVVAVSSLELTEGENVEAGLVRVRFDAAGGMRGETMPGFRTWLVSTFPELGSSGENVEALNVGGLAWDPERGLLLFGVRYPTANGRPYVLQVRVRDWAGPWTTSNLERVGVSTIQRDDDVPGEKGVLDIARLPNQPGFAVILGDATGKAKHAGFYVWDGSGEVARHVDAMVFHPEMKPEGIAFGTIGGTPVAVLVDDTGGYYVVRQADLDAKILAAS